jgi:hypothetical protein
LHFKVNERLLHLQVLFCEKIRAVSSPAAGLRGLIAGPQFKLLKPYIVIDIIIYEDIAGRSVREGNTGFIQHFGNIYSVKVVWRVQF